MIVFTFQSNIKQNKTKVTCNVKQTPISKDPMDIPAAETYNNLKVYMNMFDRKWFSN